MITGLCKCLNAETNRERERERERQTDRQTDRQKETVTEKGEGVCPHYIIITKDVVNQCLKFGSSL